MSPTLQAGSFILAGLCFILALAGLSKHETSKRGNVLGIIGMGMALLFTILGVVMGYSGYPGTAAPNWAIAAILIPMIAAAIIGVLLATRVEMTGMPQLIALLHSFVGLTAVFVGWTSHLEAELVHVEVNSGETGELKLVLVGLPDTAVKESNDRVFSALGNSGFKKPRARTTINLAPGDIRKEGRSTTCPSRAASSPPTPA